MRVNAQSEEGTSAAQLQHVGLLVNRSSDSSYTTGMIHNKIHLINPADCPGPSIALQVQCLGLKHIIPSREAILNRLWLQEFGAFPRGHRV